MGSKKMLLWPVVLLVVVALGYGLYRAATGQTELQSRARELDATLVEEYCRLVAEERYAEAFEGCLTRDYRDSVTPEDFAQAQRKRRLAVGAMQGRSLLLVRSSRNLFSGTRSFELHYELEYEQGAQPRVLVLSDADGPMRVDGTYVTSASSTLTFEVW